MEFHQTSAADAGLFRLDRVAQMFILIDLVPKRQTVTRFGSLTGAPSIFIVQSPTLPRTAMRILDPVLNKSSDENEQVRS